MKINNLRHYIKFILLTVMLVANGSVNAEIGGDFTLKDYNNNEYKLSDSEKIKIIFFGFLNCPDICPTALSEVSSLLKKLEKFCSYLVTV